MHRLAPAPILVALAVALALAACGEQGSEGGGESGAAPDPAGFPAPEGRTLPELLAEADSGAEELVLSPGGQVFRPGSGRYGFGLFTLGGDPVGDGELALYIARGAEGRVKGPFTASTLDLRTEPRYRSKTSEHDADSAFAVELEFDGTGEYRVAGLVRRGGKLVAAGRISIRVDSYDEVPATGERAPRVSTPTADEVSDIAEIDTRQPPSSMHDVDLAEVLGKQPVVLLFATPALCQSRVCGPVVDIAEQVKQQGAYERVAFIHMEIYKDNDPNKGVRRQVSAYNLPTEPWLFVIDRRGRISTAIEGAFSAAELETALRKVS